jgi:hypothetical protein
MRCIDKAGGFDNYIMKTKSQWLGPGLGTQLKEEMNFALFTKSLRVEGGHAEANQSTTSPTEADTNSAANNQAGIST